MYIKAVHIDMIKRSELSIILFGVRVLSVSVTLFKPVKVLSRLCILSAPNCPLYCLGFESSLFLLHFSNPRMYYQGCAYSVLRTVHYTVWGSSLFCICYTFHARGCISRLCILSALNCPLYCLGFESFLYLLHFSRPRMYIKAVHIKRSELSIILFGVRVLSVSVTLFKPADVLSRLFILSAPNCTLYCLGFESSLFLLHFSNPRMYYQGCAY